MSIQSVSQNIKSILNRFVATPENAWILGQEVTFHAHYRDYRAWLLYVNEVTGRAEILMDDDVRGCYDVLFVDLDRVEG